MLFYQHLDEEVSVSTLQTGRDLPVIAVKGDASRGRFGFREMASVICATRQIVGNASIEDSPLKSQAMGGSKKHLAKMDIK